MTAYATKEVADAYFANSLQSVKWATFNSSLITLALNDATRLINNLAFKWEKTVEGQENQWPRNDEATPQAIIDATCELAFELLKSNDLEFDIRQLAVVSEQIDRVKTTYDTEVSLEHIVHGIPSIKAWRLLKPYLRDGCKLSMVRI